MRPKTARSVSIEIFDPASALTRSTIRNSVPMRPKRLSPQHKAKDRTMKIINSLLMLLFTSILLAAQQPATPLAKPVLPPKRFHRVLKPAASATPNLPPNSPSGFFVGEARVDVTKDETVV